MNKFIKYVRSRPLDSYDDLCRDFLYSYFKDKMDDNLKRLIFSASLEDVFNYVWDNHKEAFFDDEIQLIFERYIIKKYEDLNKLDIVLNLAKEGIYVKEKDISLDECLIEENKITTPYDEKIYNIHRIIQSMKN